jgi:putative hemolysin
MADSTASTVCALCGGPLDERDRDRGTCRDCRSPKGKIADLDIAIRASGDDPNRISDWPAIRHLLRRRFGEDRSDSKLWQRCTDWLRAEGRLAPNDYLPLPLNYLQWLLENGFTQSDQEAGNEKLAALHAFQRELENWNCSNSPSETGYVVEDVPVGHPVHAAVVALQPFYGGALPKPALGYWRAFLRLARSDDEAAEDEAERLLEWVNGEIESHRADEHPDGNHAEIRTVGDLWKALDEGKTPAVVVSAISLGPPFGPNTAQPKFPKPADQSKWDVLDLALALCDAEGGDRAEAMRKLIARIALARGVDRREIINMPLAGFVEAAAGSRDSTAPKVKAGEAFLRATENDADAKAALQHARERMHAFAKAMQEAVDSPEYRAAQEAERQRWQTLADAIREAVEAAGDELESRHCARPDTIEDWEHLARIVEIPAETIKTGNLTAREIFACALAWADRQTIKAKLAAETKDDAETRPVLADPVSPSAKTNARGEDQAAIRLLSVFTNGLADERLDKAGSVLDDDKLTVDEKLWKIDALMPIPPTVSAAKLGKALGVSKTAVQNTTWYIQNRKGQKDNEIGRRREQHRQRGQQYEGDRQPDND